MCTFFFSVPLAILSQNGKNEITKQNIFFFETKGILFFLNFLTVISYANIFIYFNSITST